MKPLGHGNREPALQLISRRQRSFSLTKVMLQVQYHASRGEAGMDYPGLRGQCQGIVFFFFLTFSRKRTYAPILLITPTFSRGILFTSARGIAIGANLAVFDGSTS